MPWHGDGDGWTVVSRKSKGKGKSGVWLDFLLEIPFVILFTVGEVGLWSMSLCVLSRSRRLSCVFCRDPGDCLVCAVTIPAAVLRVLSRSRRLSCVCCHDPGDCLSFVSVWIGRIQKHNGRCGNGSRTSGIAGWRRKKR